MASAKDFLKDLLFVNNRLDTSNWTKYAHNYVSAIITPHFAPNPVYNQEQLREGLRQILREKGIYADSGIDADDVNWNIHFGNPGNITIVMKTRLYDVLKERSKARGVLAAH